MANEAQLRVSLQIRKGNIDHQSRPTAFSGDVDATDGPTPGSVTVSTSGTSVTFSELTVPGYCTIQNLDDTNFVEYGVYAGSTWVPFGEILPGEIYVVRFSRNLFYGASGTAHVNNLRLKANTAACNVVVNCFEA